MILSYGIKQDKLVFMNVLTINTGMEQDVFLAIFRIVLFVIQL